MNKPLQRDEVFLNTFLNMGHFSDTLLLHPSIEPPLRYTNSGLIIFPILLLFH